MMMYPRWFMIWRLIVPDLVSAILNRVKIRNLSSMQSAIAAQAMLAYQVIDSRIAVWERLD